MQNEKVVSAFASMTDRVIEIINMLTSEEEQQESQIYINSIIGKTSLSDLLETPVE